MLALDCTKAEIEWLRLQVTKNYDKQLTSFLIRAAMLGERTSRFSLHREMRLFHLPGEVELRDIAALPLSFSEDWLLLKADRKNFSQIIHQEKQEIWLENDFAGTLRRAFILFKVSLVDISAYSHSGRFWVTTPKNRPKFLRNIA